MFTEHLLTHDTKATFTQAALDIGIWTIENFNKVLAEMTKHAFSAYAFHKQKRHLHRHLIKPRNMKLCSFITRLQELNTYLGVFPSDTYCQTVIPLSADEIMDIIYHSMPTYHMEKQDD